MKVIIAGSRSIKDMMEVRRAIAATDFEITEVVCGGAGGVDTLGEQWAKEKGIPVKRFPAQWSQHGRSAGHVRNALMAQYADAAVLVWDGISPGTFSMKNEMFKRRKPFHIQHGSPS